jgi:hypothetical protein
VLILRHHVVADLLSLVSLLLFDRNLTECLLAILLGAFCSYRFLGLHGFEMLGVRFFALGVSLANSVILHRVQLLHQMMHLALVGLHQHCSLGFVRWPRAFAKELGLGCER